MDSFVSHLLGLVASLLLEYFVSRLRNNKPSVGPSSGHLTAKLVTNGHSRQMDNGTETIAHESCWRSLPVRAAAYSSPQEAEALVKIITIGAHLFRTFCCWRE